MSFAARRLREELGPGYVEGDFSPVAAVDLEGCVSSDCCPNLVDSTASEGSGCNNLHAAPLLHPNLELPLPALQQ